MNWKLPVTGKVSQPFRANPAWYLRMIGQHGHNGIDYAVQSGTPVTATADGVVAYEGRGEFHGWMLSPAGICVILRHNRAHSGYAHLSRTVVNIGQRVKAGDIIGYSGATGTATGPHLHFEALPLVPNFNNGLAGRINPAIFRLGVPDVPPKKWAVTKSIANVRKQPKLSASLAGSKQLPKGTRFEYVAVVTGDKVSGNNKWYKSAVGNYVWSGNVKK